MQADDLASPTGMLLSNLGSTLFPIGIQWMPAAGIQVVDFLFAREIKPSVQPTHGLL
jgi:hypothetical protein